MKLQIAKDNYIKPITKEFTVSLDSDSILSEPKKYKLLVASDLHLGYIINRKVLEKYVEVINEQAPDIVVVVGDLIDYYLEPLKEEGCDEVLRLLDPPKGVYFIPGNHEYKTNIDENLNWIHDAGFTILKDSIANIDNELYLIGWDDRINISHRTDLVSLIEKTPSLQTSILFTHQPEDISEAYRLNIPLTISGHTHNGHVFPFNWGVYIKDHFYGFHQEENTCSYVTSGMGLSGLPLKLMADSEFAVFNIEIK
ncbi:metallophosphoesterase [Bacteroidales bacterium OttesenSCG-928-M11]|nr:metallophosphoesterase [Bacteroidales bacterium OttesenSCG-928-M11]